MNKNNDYIGEQEYQSIFGGDVVFEGEAKFEDSVLIRGTVSGKVTAEDRVHVADVAKLDVTFYGDVISISGEVKGHIHAKRHIELCATGKIQGKIETPLLTVEAGGKLNGESKMDFREQKEQKEQQGQ